MVFKRSVGNRVETSHLLQRSERSRCSGRRRSQPSEGTASVTEMNCEVDLEQELIAAHTRTNLNELENRILISTLTEHHPDHLIVSGVRIDGTERVSVEQFPIGTKLASRSHTRSKAT